MKFLLYFFSISTVLLILISNPKSSNLNNFMNQDNLIELTNNNQIVLQKIIMTCVLIFFVLTIYSIIYASG